MKELFTLLWTEVTSWRPFTRTMRIATVFEDVGTGEQARGVARALLRAHEKSLPPAGGDPWAQLVCRNAVAAGDLHDSS